MDLTDCSSDSKTALETAIESNNLDNVLEVLNSEININEKNEDKGNTALHTAISMDVNTEILEYLLKRGANPNIINDLGKTPVQSLKPTSFTTALNILELEEQYSFSEIRFNWNELWSILFDRDNLCYKINVQNIYGSTVLLYASTGKSAAINLENMLNNIDNLHLFLTNHRGDTFMHAYFGVVDIKTDFKFVRMLLQGQFRYCSKIIVQKLLRCQNHNKNTPFHVFLRNLENTINTEMLELFRKAGAEVNTYNASGQTVLHCAIRNRTHNMCGIDQEDEENIIRYLVTEGGDINAQDGYGESPIFRARQFNTVRTLLQLGANLNIRNKFHQTPFLAHMTDHLSEPRVISLLIEYGADVTEEDAHGSNVLHYIAWHNLNVRTIRICENRNMESISDKLGELPCDVAYRNGCKEIFYALCKCDNHLLYARNEKVCFHKTIIDFKDLCDVKTSNMTEVLPSYFKYSTSVLMNTPNVGLVNLQTEANIIIAAVADMVKGLCTEIYKKDELLSNVVIQTGSIGELTKVGLPEEFDFVCILNKFGYISDIDNEKSNVDPRFCYMKLKPEFTAHKCNVFFNENGYLETYMVWERFSSLLKDVFEDSKNFAHPNIRYNHHGISGVYNPTCHFYITWRGSYYKNLQIVIDLVPACQVKGWWPINSDVQSVQGSINDWAREGALLLFQTDYECWIENIVYYPRLRVSACLAEKTFLNYLPKIARDAYILSKIYSSKKVCPSLYIEEKSITKSDGHKVTKYIREKGLCRSVSDRSCFNAERFIKSYMLKNCLFHTFQKYIETERSCDHVPYTDDEIKQLVVDIFRELLKFSSEERLPSFVFPWIDVFTFKGYETDAEKNHMLCTFRKVFAKLLLMFLGDDQDFKDIDTNILLSSEVLPEIESD
ncbi:unnamed protein product [Mytilus coruscus]|uniref:Mab-21-like nucleotidyltransferase domain-containing protein n=1 Tax=Mytilus coruscus TaxID=42192 RepID=A0A6J8AIJ4_MYTCO|nr:unnamed protein product [Mytilus coruscus]